MDLVEPSDDPKPHTWLRWVGLQEPPPTADSWVPVARGLYPDFGQETSKDADRVIEKLASADIEARQRTYQFDGSRGPSSANYVSGVAGSISTRVGVLVHNHDRERALPIVAEMKQIFDREAEERENYQPVSDEELTRRALSAAPPWMKRGEGESET